LRYILRRPTAPAGDVAAPPPLLLLLHGVGSNEQSMASLAAAFDPRFVVLAVRAPYALGATSFAWFHVEFTVDGPSINAAEAEASWHALARFIDEAVTAFGADPAHVFVGGFSQGGIMSLATLLTAPTRLAGAFSMSGRLLPEVLPHAAPLAQLDGRPVLIVHGVHDTKLGVHFARHARDELQKLPVALTYRELEMAHEVTPQSIALVRAWVSETLNA
jgi:phospholipase/carboxylesterase